MGKSFYHGLLLRLLNVSLCACMDDKNFESDKKEMKLQRFTIVCLKPFIDVISL